MKQLPNEGYRYLRSGIIISPPQDKLIEQVLTELLQKLPARFILLSDVTGQIISAQGDYDHTDLVALGSVVAGDLAASQEMARLTGEYQASQMILREGQQAHSFILGAGDYLVLLVQISTDIPLGWARMLIRASAHQLAEIMAEPQAEEKRKFDLGPEQDNLHDLVDNLLDEMWLE